MLYQGQMSHIQTLYKLLSKFSHAINFYIGPLTLQNTSLVPRPYPAFCCLQYGKRERAWYLFSRE